MTLGTTENLSDTETLVLTIYGEARGESIEGQIAVACVIRNRAGNSKSIKEICLAPFQFSCWNKNDPNYPILMEIADKLIIGQKLTDPILRQCIWVAQGVINSDLLDITHGAEYYLTNQLIESGKLPSWALASKRINESVIDHQTFFNV